MSFANDDAKNWIESNKESKPQPPRHKAKYDPREDHPLKLVNGKEEPTFITLAAEETKDLLNRPIKDDEEEKKVEPKEVPKEEPKEEAKEEPKEEAKEEPKEEPKEETKPETPAASQVPEVPANLRPPQNNGQRGPNAQPVNRPPPPGGFPSGNRIGTQPVAPSS